MRVISNTMMKPTQNYANYVRDLAEAMFTVKPIIIRLEPGMVLL